MPDVEKVIRCLEQCLDDSIAAVVPADTVRDALALLKAQEPVSPTRDDDGDLLCGVCGEGVVGYKIFDESGIYAARDNYCPKCGQAVKWE